MAKTKLKSVFTREDVYTVLQLLKALADGVDTNEELTDADIEKLKTSIDKLNGAINIAEDNTTTIANGIVIKPTGDVDIGKNLDVDGQVLLNAPTDLVFTTGSLPKQYYWHFVRMAAYDITGDNPNSYNFSFLMPATSNLPIHNIDDLITVFEGDYIQCVGKMTYPGGTGQLYGLKVGSTLETTKILFSSAPTGIEDDYGLSNYPIREIIDTVFLPK